MDVLTMYEHFGVLWNEQVLSIVFDYTATLYFNKTIIHMMLLYSVIYYSVKTIDTVIKYVCTSCGSSVILKYK